MTPNEENQLVLCDRCDDAYHIRCVVHIDHKNRIRHCSEYQTMLGFAMSVCDKSMPK